MSERGGDFVAGDEGMEQEAQKMVPVSESIRYRKRAQSAESQAEGLVKELEEAKGEAARMGKELEQLRLEQELTRRLSAAGAMDLEAAVLLGKARIQSGDGDVDAVIEELKASRSYLFGDAEGGYSVPGRSGGAKERVSDGQRNLEKAAKRAAVTGSRVDLQRYLELRRKSR